MARPRVLLTNPIDPAGVDLIEAGAEVVQAPDQRPETLRAMAREADVIVVRAQLPEDIFEHAPRVLGAVRHGAGVDMIPIEAATAHGVLVANVPGVNAEAVAEYCIAGMLLIARGTHRIDRTLREKDWNSARAFADEATELFGRTVGIVGVGNVGRRVAEICHTAFRMPVLGHQRRLAALPEFVRGASLETLFAEADYIVLACPLTPETRNLVTRALVGRMKASAGLINVSRGAVVDEPALTEALAARRIRGAVLDVYATQPLPRDHPLLALENVVLTTHLAGITGESMRCMSEVAAAECLRIISGERPVNLVNPLAWAARRRASG